MAIRMLQQQQSSKRHLVCSDEAQGLCLVAKLIRYHLQAQKQSGAAAGAASQSIFTVNLPRSLIQQVRGPLPPAAPAHQPLVAEAFAAVAGTTFRSWLKAGQKASLRCVLHYKPDRHASKKLAQVYHLLAPSTDSRGGDLNGDIYEQNSSHLCARLLRATKGAEHHSQPGHGGPAGVCPSSPICVPPEWIFEDDGYSGQRSGAPRAGALA